MFCFKVKDFFLFYKDPAFLQFILISPMRAVTKLYFGERRGILVLHLYTPTYMYRLILH